VACSGRSPQPSGCTGLTDGTRSFPFCHEPAFVATQWAGVDRPAAWPGPRNPADPTDRSSGSRAAMGTLFRLGDTQSRSSSTPPGGRTGASSLGLIEACCRGFELFCNAPFRDLLMPNAMRGPSEARPCLSARLTPGLRAMGLEHRIGSSTHVEPLVARGRCVQWRLSAISSRESLLRLNSKA
jgi:hypothetical protein